jgi:hypothetical protein
MAAFKFQSNSPPIQIVRTISSPWPQCNNLCYWLFMEKSIECTNMNQLPVIMLYDNIVQSMYLSSGEIYDYLFIYLLFIIC